jgi:hypothetical protein
MAVTLPAHAYQCGDWNSTPDAYNTFSNHQIAVGSYTDTPSDVYYQGRISTNNMFTISTTEAQQMYVLADDYVRTGEVTVNGPRKSRPGSWDNPQTPIGDVPMLLVALFAGVVVMIQRKRQQD